MVEINRIIPRVIHLLLMGLMVACSLPNSNQPNTTIGLEYLDPTAIRMPVQELYPPVTPSSSAPQATLPPTANQPAPAENGENQGIIATTGDQLIYMPTLLRDGKKAQLFGVSIVPLTEQGGITSMKDAGTVWTRTGIDWNSIERAAGVWAVSYTHLTLPTSDLV